MSIDRGHAPKVRRRIFRSDALPAPLVRQERLSAATRHRIATVVRAFDAPPVWTGPVERHAVTRQPSITPVPCRLCGHWSHPANLACAGCGAPHPGGTP